MSSAGRLRDSRAEAIIVPVENASTTVYPDPARTCLAAPRRYIVARVTATLLVAKLLGGCATTPPDNQTDLCAVFEQHPAWYDAARASRERWGTPIATQMAFVQHESAFREDAQRPFEWFLFIPLGRDSSAYGYGQIQDPAWADYKDATGGWFKSRSDMDDVLDFIGWYNDISARRLGIAKANARHLYLAYHEGHAGYRSGKWRGKNRLLAAADKVQRRADRYARQLQRCESRFRCRHWYQFWPFCSK